MVFATSEFVLLAQVTVLMAHASGCSKTCYSTKGKKKNSPANSQMLFALSVLVCKCLLMFKQWCSLEMAAGKWGLSAQ